jgi:hypothetical protein
MVLLTLALHGRQKAAGLRFPRNAEAVRMSM